MQYVDPEYEVVSVRRAQPASARSRYGDDAPSEIRERFSGRTFTLHELEQRGVRIAGATASYTANGLDWQLETSPALGSL